jgi:hypothetical protein
MFATVRLNIQTTVMFATVRLNIQTTVMFATGCIQNKTRPFLTVC